jgi:hypothetical protein
VLLGQCRRRKLRRIRNVFLKERGRERRKDGQETVTLRAMGSGLSISVMSWLNLGRVSWYLRKIRCSGTHRFKISPVSVAAK